MHNSNGIAISKHICPICMQAHEANEILIHKRMKDISEADRITGYELCPEHAKQVEEGWIGLIGADESKSQITKENIVTLEGVVRTGKYIMVKREFLTEQLNLNLDPANTFVFVDDKFIDWLDSLTKADEGIIEE